MKSIFGFGIAALFVVVPVSAHAHEQQVFKVDGALYRFTVGSLNEPVMVDDKTGVDLRVAKVLAGTYTPGAPEVPVEGLEHSLAVELHAEGVSKDLALQTVYGAAGSYKAPFYPTRPMKVSYRFHGTLAGKPFDVSFSCNPAGHSMTAMQAQTEPLDLGNGIVRVYQSGALGCPVARDAVNFPEDVSSLGQLRASTTQAQVLASIALALAVVGFVRGRTRPQ